MMQAEACNCMCFESGRNKGNRSQTGSRTKAAERCPKGVRGGRMFFWIANHLHWLAQVSEADRHTCRLVQLLMHICGVNSISSCTHTHTYMHTNTHNVVHALGGTPSGCNNWNWSWSRIWCWRTAAALHPNRCTTVPRAARCCCSQLDVFSSIYFHFLLKHHRYLLPISTPSAPHRTYTTISCLPKRQGLAVRARIMAF